MGEAKRRSVKRPGSGRRKTPIELDPDRFFIVIWRISVWLLGCASDEAGKLAAHLLSAEPILMSNVEDGVLNAAGATIDHHADSLKTRVDGLVKKAQHVSVSDGDWIDLSEIAISSLVLAGFMFLRPDLSVDARKRLSADAEKLRVELRELGWDETLARLEARINAARGSNWPPLDQLGPAGRRLLRLVKELPRKK